jgi:hypothetical protein
LALSKNVLEPFPMIEQSRFLIGVFSTSPLSSGLFPIFSPTRDSCRTLFHRISSFVPTLSQLPRLWIEFLVCGDDIEELNPLVALLNLLEVYTSLPPPHGILWTSSSQCHLHGLTCDVFNTSIQSLSRLIRSLLHFLSPSNFSPAHHPISLSLASYTCTLMIFETIILLFQISEGLKPTLDVDKYLLETSLLTLFTLCEQILIHLTSESHSRKHLRVQFQKYIDLKLISPLYQKEIWKLLYTSSHQTPPPTHVTLSKSQETIRMGEPIAISLPIPSPKKEQKPRKITKSRIEVSREDSLRQTQKRKKFETKEHIPRPSAPPPPALQVEDEEVTDTSSMNSATMTDPKAPNVKPTKVHGTADVWDITATPSLLDQFNLSF